MENETIITREKNFQDFLNNPLFLLISLPTIVLAVCNIIFTLREIDYLMYNLLLADNFAWIASNISGILIYFPAFIVYLAYTISFVLIFFSNKIQIPNSVLFTIFKIGVVVAILFEIINFIVSIVFFAVYDIEQIFYLAKSIPDTFFDVITPLLSLFFINSIEKSIKYNMIYKKFVSLFIVSSIISLVFVMQKLIVYFSVSFSPYLIFLLAEGLYLILFVIIGIQYIRFFNTEKTDDEIEDVIIE